MAGSNDKQAPLMLSVSGCRGIVGASLTPGLVCEYVGAFAGWLRDRGGGDTDSPIVVGRDGRAGGEVPHALAMGALRAAGFDVVDLGVAMTATVGVMIDHHDAAGGVVLTASHNPAEWNGIKCLVAPGSAPAPSDAEEILTRYRAGAPLLAGHDALGAARADDTSAHVHVGRVLKALSEIADLDRIKGRAFKVALDSVNASGSRGGAMLLESLGCELVHLNAESSGVFPHTPEPTAKNLAGLCETVRGQRVDVAFAQDPDADRLAVVDESGGYIGEEYTLAISAQTMLRARGAGVIAANLSTSRMVDDIAQAAGGRVVRTPVGEANVVAGMRDAGDDCILGGEGNGGVIWPDVVDIRDSLSAMALTLAAMSATDAPISALVREIPSYSIGKRKLPIRDGLAAAAIRAVSEAHADQRVDTQDGVRVDFENERAWLHVRASNTEPILRLIAEAPDDDLASKILDDAGSLVDSL